MALEFKYNDTSDDGVRICPYCGESYQPEGEDYSSDEREEECSSCGKKYYAQDDFSVTHYATPDCELNNEPHQWTHTLKEAGREHQFCGICGKLR